MGQDRIDLANSLREYLGAWEAFKQVGELLDAEGGAELRRQLHYRAMTVADLARRPGGANMGHLSRVANGKSRWTRRVARNVLDMLEQVPVIGAAKTTATPPSEGNPEIQSKSERFGPAELNELIDQPEAVREVSSG